MLLRLIEFADLIDITYQVGDLASPKHLICVAAGHLRKLYLMR
jgi:hypothetical protein